MNKLPISAAVIGLARDNLDRCLKSLVDLVDEIIFVDSYGTDRLRLLKYTDKVYRHEFTGLQNKELRGLLASNDWVLNVDCDEVISEDLKMK